MDKIWREKAEEETYLVSATKLIGLVGAGCLVEELFVVHSPAWSLGFLPSWLEDLGPIKTIILPPTPQIHKTCWFWSLLFQRSLIRRRIS